MPKQTLFSNIYGVSLWGLAGGIGDKPAKIIWIGFQWVYDGFWVT
ncbi:MAG: hypothetical protein AB9882_00880 [Ignavibacteriaceae bacterium]